jgi:ADP-L-glycero-D-manno-heptose 6-epimerase
MRRESLISYVPFPPELEGRYQSYTQADVSALRAAGYAADFLTVQEGVRRYCERLLEKAQR